MVRWNLVRWVGQKNACVSEHSHEPLQSDPERAGMIESVRLSTYLTWISLHSMSDSLRNQGWILELINLNDLLESRRVSIH